MLPFANLSNDPEQQYFADGITENVTTDLSRIAHSFVISRNTAFTYRNKPVDTKQIGREVGVRYVLEGEVQRSGNRVRVTAQLIDVESDAHLWAERFDGFANTGSCIGEWGPWHRNYTWFLAQWSVSSWRRSRPLAIDRASTSSGRASCSPRPIGNRHSEDQNPEQIEPAFNPRQRLR